MNWNVVHSFIIITTISCCFWKTDASGRPRGFGRQTAGFDQAQNNQLEYGSLDQGQVFDDYDGGIQQVSQDPGAEDFSNVLQQPSTGLEPPKYTQVVDTTPAEAITPKGTFIGQPQTVDGTGPDGKVIAFKGVPYGKKPVGRLRFKRPVPADTLQEPLYTTQFPNACPQTVVDSFNNFPGEKMWLPNTNMSEDCLYLNIWVPATVFDNKETELVPVLFWIYGGGFFSGSNSLDVYNGAALAASQRVIVVNVQYRLGPLGFLYLEQGQGNMGLLDQALGLKWVNKNIEYFGGNPNLVTAAGESAGAASVNFQLMSPLSKHYIKRGITTSGLPNAKYALKPAEEVKANSRQLAKYVGCEQSDAHEMVECLRNVDADTLTAAQWKLYENVLDFTFSPIVDGYFLPDHPDVLIQKGKAKRADMIMGTVQDEGTYFLLYHYVNQFSHLKPTPVCYDQFVEIMNELFNGYTELERETIINKYTNWENPEDGLANQRKIGEAVGDSWFICPQRKYADAWSNRGLAVYYYHLTQRFKFNQWGEWMGVMHGDDVPLLFGIPESEPHTENEQKLIHNFMEMVGNFMRDGIPSKNWERYSSENPVYLNVNSTIISNSSTENIHGPKAEACAFWNKLLPSLKECEECNQQNSGKLRSPAQKYRQDQTRQSQNNAQQQHYCSAPTQMICSPVPSSFNQGRECASNSQSTTEQTPTTSTSSSCSCSVEEGSTPSANGFVSPPPAIY